MGVVVTSIVETIVSISVFSLDEDDGESSTAAQSLLQGVQNVVPLREIPHLVSAVPVADLNVSLPPLPPMSPQDMRKRIAEEMYEACRKKWGPLVAAKGLMKDACKMRRTNESC
ncbi:hypothetical protein Fot_11075 [Forsythia ovata]|uniref:Uncharacterized protein n=1 Tax=Forsythia ovata TaxID=205694 RepID=A0ABD1WME6_9LAMI